MEECRAYSLFVQVSLYISLDTLGNFVGSSSNERKRKQTRLVSFLMRKKIAKVWKPKPFFPGPSVIISRS